MTEQTGRDVKLPPELSDAIDTFNRWAAAYLQAEQDADVIGDALYHYTDGRGLQGVLRTGQIWFTDYRHLNDPSELVHGIEMAHDSARGLATGADGRVQLFLEMFSDMFRRENFYATLDFFIACFSRDRDDLGQWRAYADNGRGFAIGFAPRCDIYNALKDSPSWDRTLFVITYDEHGGFYDHYPPPGTGEFAAQFPDEAFEIQPVHFPDGDVGNSLPAQSYGVRVPTIVVSPWVGAGVVSNTIFDHASIAKTILLRFAPGLVNALGPRVEHAADLGSLLTDNVRLNPPACPPVPAPEDVAVGIPPATGSVRTGSFDPADFHLSLSLFPLPLPIART